MINEWKSAEIGKLSGALAKAQLEIDNAVKGSANPFFKSKYADLASVREAVRAPLAENEIAVIQRVSSDFMIDPPTVTVNTVLAHSSGEWIGDNFSVPIVSTKFGKDGKALPPDAQAVGSAVSYARRYGLAAIVCIGQEDDDGTAAVSRDDRSQLADSVKPIRVATQVNALKARLRETVGFVAPDEEAPPPEEEGPPAKKEYAAPEITSILTWPFKSKEQGMPITEVNEKSLIWALDKAKNVEFREACRLELERRNGTQLKF